MNFGSIAAKAAEVSPQSAGPVHLIPGLTLYADGDSLAYYCAGNDNTSAGEAKNNLIAKLEAARRITGASNVRILLTSSGSTKGDRYAIARVKPYQGQRSNSRRPVNWQALRDMMEGGSVGGFDVEATATAEADDLFGKHAYENPALSVIYTQDKDMRMLPGHHLDWVSHTRVYVNADEYSGNGIDMTANGKQYGQRWFWLQMLQGDTADNIPGLPKYVNDKGVAKPVGEVTANNLLGGEKYAERVLSFYRSYYGDRAEVEMLEQACLLWMRSTPDDSLNVLGRLEDLRKLVDESAVAEIKERVQYARNINAAQAAADSSDESPPAS